jgi:predicted nucleic acid-binding Zn ribbon protein
MVTAAGFQLKGSGRYATDFKNKGGAKPADAAKKDEAKAETKSEQPACGAGACPACN